MAKRPVPAPDWFGMNGAIRRSVAEWLHGLGLRYCPRCTGVLPLGSFDRRGALKTRKLDSYCRECKGKYYKGRRADA